jgi:hypothetical protein
LSSRTSRRSIGLVSVWSITAPHLSVKCGACFLIAGSPLGWPLPELGV